MITSTIKDNHKQFPRKPTQTQEQEGKKKHEKMAGVVP